MWWNPVTARQFYGLCNDVVLGNMESRCPMKAPAAAGAAREREGGGSCTMGLCCFGVRASSCSPEACVSLYSLEEVPYLQAAWILRIIVQLFCSVVFAPALSKKSEVVQLHKSREGKPEHLSNTAVLVHSALFKIPCAYVTLCELVLWWEPASTDTKLSELGLGGWTTRILLRGDALLSCLLLEPDSSRRSACA